MTYRCAYVLLFVKKIKKSNFTTVTLSDNYNILNWLFGNKIKMNFLLSFKQTGKIPMYVLISSHKMIKVIEKKNDKTFTLQEMLKFN